MHAGVKVFISLLGVLCLSEVCSGVERSIVVPSGECAPTFQQLNRKFGLLTIAWRGVSYYIFENDVAVFKTKDKALSYARALDVASSKEVKQILSENLNSGAARLLHKGEFLLIPTPECKIVLTEVNTDFIEVDKRGKKIKTYEHQVFPIVDQEWGTGFVPDSEFVGKAHVELNPELCNVFKSSDEYKEYVNQESDFGSDNKWLAELRKAPTFVLKGGKEYSSKKRSVFFRNWEECWLYVGLKQKDKKQAKRFVELKSQQDVCTHLDDGTKVSLQGYLVVDSVCISKGNVQDICKEYLLSENDKCICFENAIISVNANGERYWVCYSDLCDTKKKK